MAASLPNLPNLPILTPSATNISAKAMALGTLSGLSLPIGAMLGLMLSPVSDKLCGRVMAFGSGALIFAVTVSIYGKELVMFEVGILQRYEDWLQIFGGFAGSIFYLYVARWLEVDDGEKADDAENAVRHERTPLFSTPAWSRKGSEASLSGAVDNTVDQPKIAKGTKSGALQDAVLAIAGEARMLYSQSLQDAVDAESEEQKRKGKQVALSLFLGLLIDGVPEGVFMGFLAARNGLNTSLVFSLFIANFPEAFSSASLLERAGMLYLPIIAMWAGLMLLVGMLAGVSCLVLLYVFPAYAEGQHLPPIAAGSVSFIEGFTGGAMLACIVSVMLPDAQHRIGKEGSLISQAGFLTTAGFLCSLGIELMCPPIS